MSNKKAERKRGYPFSIRSTVKEKDKTKEDEGPNGPKSPPRYGVYKRD